jgi:hypothetical protein
MTLFFKTKDGRRRIPPDAPSLRRVTQSDPSGKNSARHLPFFYTPTAETPKTPKGEPTKRTAIQKALTKSTGEAVEDGLAELGA